MSRLLLVSNRLPVTVKSDQGSVRIERSVGGLATGLSALRERSETIWIGWSGETGDLDGASLAELEARLGEHGAAAIHLTPAQIRGYYDGFSNGVLWPLFHHAPDRIPLCGADDWDAYCEVNERFADAAAAHYRPGDLVWVHDYHLALVPALLRQRLPDARIGFFLHIPFPASDIYRSLPPREALLDGLLGADLIGFHTASYARHFRDALRDVLGVPSNAGSVTYRQRRVRYGAYPMGVDALGFAREAASSAVESEVAALLREAGGRRILLGVDRLDYTKGIPRRLLAFERLLERDRRLGGSVRFVQVVVPSRLEVREYAELHRQINELVGRINGAMGTLDGAPVHYLFRAFSQRELIAMYRAADVCLVTPLCDGMNLVAKEYVASRVDDDGVLVLSEFAGAASELGEALLVNPYDVDGMARAFATALSMPEEERHMRMRALRERVFQGDVEHWASAFIEDLASMDPLELAATPETSLEAVLERASRAPRIVLFLDYDGTLTPFAPRPELAAPGPRLRLLLSTLARRPQTVVHIVSGRPREVLDLWLGDLGVILHAEHGGWSRTGRGSWMRRGDAASPWKASVRALMEQFILATPGAFVEEKTSSLAFHFRMADRELGEERSRELTLALGQTFRAEPIDVLHGDKVLEVRPRGIHKGLVVQDYAEALRGAMVVAMGDDRTDEDLFAALPEGAVAIHVGAGPSRASMRVPDVAAALAFLSTLAFGSDLGKAA